jgi:uncharacterized protein (TIGR00251 family)
MQNTNIPKCICKKLSKIFLTVRAKPGSKKEGIVSVDEEEIVISIKAQPVDGKANTAIISYLSDIFDLSKSDISLEKGGTSKNKLISMTDCYTEDEVLNILKENLL